MDKEINKVSVKLMEVKIGEEVRKVEVRKPTPKIEAEANMAASKVFARLVKEKDEGKSAFILRAQLNSYLSAIGIYSDQDVEDLGTFSERMKELEEVIRNPDGKKKKSEGKSAAIELRRVRYAVYMLLMKQADYDKHTVEHYADNARMNYLVSKCICFEGGAPVFNSVEDYESDGILQEVLREPIKELAALVSQFDPNFENTLPENKFLLKYNFCDKDYRLINKQGQLVDAEGNLVDKEGNAVVKEDDREAVGEFLDDDEDETLETDSPAETEEVKLEEVRVESVVNSEVIPEMAIETIVDPVPNE